MPGACLSRHSRAYNGFARSLRGSDSSPSVADVLASSKASPTAGRRRRRSRGRIRGCGRERLPRGDDSGTAIYPDDGRANSLPHGDSSRMASTTAWKPSVRSVRSALAQEAWRLREAFNSACAANLFESSTPRSHHGIISKTLAHCAIVSATVPNGGRISKPSPRSSAIPGPSRKFRRVFPQFRENARRSLMHRRRSTRVRKRDVRSRSILAESRFAGDSPSSEALRIGKFAPIVPHPRIGA